MKTFGLTQALRPLRARNLTMAFAMACGIPAAASALETVSTESVSSNAAPVQQKVQRVQRIQLPSQTDEVQKLLKAKVDSEVVKAYVKNSPMAYNLTANEIISLQEQGATSDLITAMIQRGAELRSQYQQAAQANRPPAYTQPNTQQPAPPAPEQAPAYAPMYSSEPAYQNYYPVSYPYYSGYSYPYNYWWYSYPAYSYSYWPYYGYCAPYGYYNYCGYNRYNYCNYNGNYKCGANQNYPCNTGNNAYNWRNRGYPNGNSYPYRGNMNPGGAPAAGNAAMAQRAVRPMPSGGGRGMTPAAANVAFRPNGGGVGMRSFSTPASVSSSFRPSMGASMRSFSAPSGGGFRGGGGRVAASAGRSMGRGR